MPQYDSRSAYVRDVFIREDPLLDGVLRRADEAGLPGWHIDPESRRVLEILVQALQARNVLEIGTLAGYSAIAMARKMADGGSLITMEANPEHARFARSEIAKAGMDSVIEVWEGEALDLLERAAGEGPFDLVFIDADKPNERTYVAWALDHTVPGGIILAHNAFGYGSIPSGSGWQSSESHALNEYMAQEPRLITTILPIGDGMLMGSVRG